MLPQDFTERTRQLLGKDFEAFEKALETQPPVSVRLNPKKSNAQCTMHNAQLVVDKDTNASINSQFSTLNSPLKKVPWCENGYYLEERPSFTFDPLFHAGTYYVQEAASMFLEQIFKGKSEKGENITASTNSPLILDLCAAPGGKSTHLISLLPEDSLLVSNEVIRSRCNILTENMAKWGYPNSIVTNNDPADFGKLTHLFDMIIADMPCSGEGMFRKDVASRDEWSIANVQLCASRQRRIAYNVWDALKPGGYFIYSTCTYNLEEDEDNVCMLAKELGADFVEISTLPEWNICGAIKHDIPAYRFFPHRTRSEGFFMAVLQKRNSDIDTIKYKSKTKQNNKKTVVDLSKIKEWITSSEQYFFDVCNNTAQIRAILKNHVYIYNMLSERLNVVSAGINLGEIKGKDIIPSTALAMSTALQKKAFPCVELTFEQAIKYLQKEALTLSSETPKGFILMTYQNCPLGFAKNIGNRANNLYPQEWRIRKK